MKSIIISGAGSGIGRACAEILSKSSSDNSLILLGRNAQKLEETKSKLLHPSNHIVLPVDITNSQALNHAFAEIKLEERHLSAVIANAGIGGENHYGRENVQDRWHEIINTNPSCQALSVPVV